MTVLALVAICVELPGLFGTSLLRESQAAYRSGDIPLAASRADDSVASEPWAATAHMQRALIAEARDQLPNAVADVRRAVALEPTNWRPRLLLARMAAEQGDAAGALAAYRAAKRLRPKSSFFQPR